MVVALSMFALGAGLMFTSGCSAFVPGNSGTVTAVNFVPADSPTPWSVYYDLDDTGEPRVVKFADRPGVHVGDHVTEYYWAEGGTFQDLHRTRRPRSKPSSGGGFR